MFFPLFALLFALFVGVGDFPAPTSLKKPKVSIITSVWNGDEFIEGFLADITQQTIFEQCELILINANSPGHEEPIIKTYMARYPNILYVKLAEDPGLYAVWNQAIQMASGEFLMNANLDDRSSYDAVDRHVKELEADPTVDLVYTGYHLTEISNETFADNHHVWVVDSLAFSPKNMWKCLPGPRPVWRKSLHDHYGLFDPTFSSAGDQEMWMRAVSLGATFKRIPGFTTLFYMNPKGVSSDADPAKSSKRSAEHEHLAQKYAYLWES